MKSHLRGQTLMEYLLLASVIAIVAVVALVFLSGRIHQIIETVGQTF